MELPIFLLNDATGGVIAFHDRETLDAMVISPKDAEHLTAWGSDGERLAHTIEGDRWQIGPAESPVVDIELLRYLLLERLDYWYESTRGHIERERIIESAGAFFAARKRKTGWQALADSLNRDIGGP